MLFSDFEPEFAAKVDQYLTEDLRPPIVGGFEVFCSTAIIDNYANAHNVTPEEMVQVIKRVFNKRLLRFVTDGPLGVVHTSDGLLENVCEAVSDFSADKQEKLAAAMNPTDEGDAAGAQFAGPTLASAAQSHPVLTAAQSHPVRTTANGRRVSPAGSAAAEDLMNEGEQLPPANANPVINGLECPPPPS